MVFGKKNNTTFSWIPKLVLFNCQKVVKMCSFSKFMTVYLQRRCRPREKGVGGRSKVKVNVTFNIKILPDQYLDNDFIDGPQICKGGLPSHVYDPIVLGQSVKGQDHSDILYKILIRARTKL